MSKKFISVDAQAVKAKLGQASKRAAKAVSKRAVSKGSVVKERIAAGGKVAIAKITTAGVKLTQKQLEKLEKAKSKYSGS